MVDRLAPTVVRTAAVIRKSGLWDMALIVGAFVLYYLVRAVVVTGNHFILDMLAGTTVALFGLWAAVALDRHGARVWNLVAPPSLRSAQA